MQNQKNSISVANLNMRTTSSLESFNAVLNRSIAKKANFFKFLERLKLHESRKADDMHSRAHHTLPEKHFKRRHLRDQERENKIRSLTTLLESGAISTGDFLQAMANESSTYAITFLRHGKTRNFYEMNSRYIRYKRYIFIRLDIIETIFLHRIFSMYF